MKQVPEVIEWEECRKLIVLKIMPGRTSALIGMTTGLFLIRLPGSDVTVNPMFCPHGIWFDIQSHV